jgi:hypothetical protein
MAPFGGSRTRLRDLANTSRYMLATSIRISRAGQEEILADDVSKTISSQLSAGVYLRSL